jgi:hypothetical protein
MPQTVCPSDDREKLNYYFGLPSSPILVARSSNDVWFDTHTWPEQKRIENVAHTSLYRGEMLFSRQSQVTLTSNRFLGHAST